MDQLLDWPWQRFERFYEIFVRKSLVEGLERRKEQMITALWSNSNWDDDKGTRKQAVEELEENFQAAIDRINGYQPEEEVEMEDKFGFFAAGERAVARIEVPGETNGTVAEAAEQSDYKKFIDQ